MSKMHKIGGHVLGEQRNGWGNVAPQMVCCVSLQDGAFHELPEKAIKIYRTQQLENHVDIAGDFDKLPDKDLKPAAAWWWTQLKPLYEKVHNNFKNVYFQPINEINNHRAAAYMEGMMDAAHKDGYKLALFGDAGDSPTWENFTKYWIPILRKGAEQGHIYCRHAYSGVGTKADYLTNDDGTPTDDNTGRPFREAQYLNDQGISIPIVIGELGWQGGYKRPGYHFLADLTRYNALMMKYDNIVGGALWTWGNWDTKQEANLEGEKTADLARWMSDYKPKLYDFSFKASGKGSDEVKDPIPPPAINNTIIGEEDSAGSKPDKVGQAQGQTGTNQSISQQDHGRHGIHSPGHFGRVIPSISAAAGSGGIAAHLTALIYQLAALGLSSPNILQRAISGAVQPLTHELRMNYGGQEYLVQLAQASGQEWRAYYSLVSEPTKVMVVSTHKGIQTGQVQKQEQQIVFQEDKGQSATAHSSFVVDQVKDDSPAIDGALIDDLLYEANFDTVEAEDDGSSGNHIRLEKIPHGDGFILPLAFRSQNGPGARAYGGDCGPTCCSMIIEAVRGLKLNPDDLMEKIGKTSANPLENYTLLDKHLNKMVLNPNGLQGTYQSGTTLDQIEKYLAEGKPVIALINYEVMDKAARAPVRSTIGWHYIALLGFDENTFFFYDPLHLKETISRISKTNFTEATKARGDVKVPHQTLVVESMAGAKTARWAKNLPAGYSFVMANGNQAKTMKKPGGELTTAWVYTGEEIDKPWLSRNGKMVQVHRGGPFTSLNVRSAPAEKVTVDGQEVSTKIGVVKLGQTMILTGAYKNKYAQVLLELDAAVEPDQKKDTTKKPETSGGVGQTIDLKDYFFAEPGKQIMVKHPKNIGSEKFLTQDLGGGWYLMQKNNKWELWKVDDKYIYLVDDVSPANDSGGTKRFYRVRKSPDSDKLTPYCKRHMKVGQKFGDGGHFVQFYRISNGHKLDENSGSTQNTFEFLGQGEAIKTLNGQDTLEDVIHVKGGTEEHWFAKGLGRIAWTSEWGQSKIEEIIKNHQEPPKVHIPSGYSAPAGVTIEGVKIGNEGF